MTRSPARASVTSRMTVSTLTPASRAALLQTPSAPFAGERARCPPHAGRGAPARMTVASPIPEFASGNDCRSPVGLAHPPLYRMPNVHHSVAATNTTQLPGGLDPSVRTVLEYIAGVEARPLRFVGPEVARRLLAAGAALDLPAPDSVVAHDDVIALADRRIPIRVYAGGSAARHRAVLPRRRLRDRRPRVASPAVRPARGSVKARAWPPSTIGWHRSIPSRQRWRMPSLQSTG